DRVLGIVFDRAAVGKHAQVSVAGEGDGVRPLARAVPPIDCGVDGAPAAPVEGFEHPVPAVSFAPAVAGDVSLEADGDLPGIGGRALEVATGPADASAE